ncbi:hypothetical protein CAC42_330 [Sphaceloma murrayae]|uniref:Zinc transporter n=1 Tax=Sphaceloma murrayae TaxID=2082308 RepID=A0A2K1R093_9PEZI|nr:hypothetical protein CAC42_330 [Sphaceloma murrayae]
MASGYALPHGGSHKHSRGQQSFTSLNGSYSSPYIQEEAEDTFPSNGTPANGNAVLHSHKLPMKGRLRGDSDLGRPAGTVLTASADQSSIPRQLLIGILIPTPYILASLLSASTTQRASVTEELEASLDATSARGYGPLPPLLTAGFLTAATMLLCGISGWIFASSTSLDRRKNSDPNTVRDSGTPFTPTRIRSVVRAAISIGLPFYAAALLGGQRTGMFMLLVGVSAASSLPFDLSQLSKTLKRSIGLCTALSLSILADFSHFASKTQRHDLALGYMALMSAMFVMRPAYLDAPAAIRFKASPIVGRASTTQSLQSPSVFPDFIATEAASRLTTLLGGVLVALVFGSSYILGSLHMPRNLDLLILVVATAAAVALIFFGRPESLGARRSLGLAAGSIVSAASLSVFDMRDWSFFAWNISLVVVTALCALYDFPTSLLAKADNTLVHTGHKHHHGKVSFLTAFLLGRVTRGSLIYDILSEKDSRRIAYFTCLNFGFMLVQGFYGWVSGSLGLLSDTVHMFFDCLALIIGLAASVASKWPTSPEKPYGWGKLNTLAGFGNGVFLMLVSVEFVWGAIEGIMEGTELRRVEELLVVTHPHSGHENENMHGIYLHIAADAGGSLAVIISTTLTLWKPWYLWDPLATILIAILIFMAAVPLVIGSAKKLLLVIPEDLEYELKNALHDLVTVRGVTGFAAPRFWLEDKEGDDGHGHSHHGHGHSHSHVHDEEQKTKLLGVIHVFASRAASMDDVRERSVQFFRDRGMEVVVQVEREGEGRCWCGGGTGEKMN